MIYEDGEHRIYAEAGGIPMGDESTHDKYEGATAEGFGVPHINRQQQIRGMARAILAKRIRRQQDVATPLAA